MKNNKTSKFVDIFIIVFELFAKIALLPFYTVKAILEIAKLTKN